MAKTKISEFNANPALNTDIDSINIAEGCAPSGINDAIRELMAQLKDWQSGTSNDPMVIGSSGSLTLNQGTANGVAYLNGSKVVTSGSALTFDGTNLGVGVSSASAPIDVVSASSTVGVYVRGRSSDNIGSIYFTANGSTATEYGYLQGRSTDLRLYTANSNPLLFGINGSEQMRLTSTGLGIGTSSPSQKLTVAAASPTIRLSDTTTSVVGGVFGTIDWQSADGSMSGGLAAKIDVFDDGGAYGDRGALRFFTNNATSLGERMRIDSSGNLGLGVTPSAWSGFVGLQVGALGGLNLGGAIDDNFVGSNVYYNAGFKFARPTTATYATMYRQSSGVHSWQVSTASGTAGNAITFTQAMTLDASGNLGIGTTSPASKLHVVGNTRITADIESTGNSIVYSSNGSAAGTINAGIYLVGSDSSSRFYTGNSERARIDSSGNLLVKITSAIGSETVQASGSGTTNKYCYFAAADVSTYTGYAMRVYSTTNSAVVGSITFSTTNTAYNTSSDQRLKENIQNAESASSVIDSLQVRKFDWKTDGSHQRYGFVAQELVTVYPEAVHQPENTDEMMAVDYSKLVPMLTKAIQEQQAIIESLKARLDAANL